jgi:hypothetical protein
MARWLLCFADARPASDAPEVTLEQLESRSLPLSSRFPPVTAIAARAVEWTTLRSALSEARREADRGAAKRDFRLAHARAAIELAERAHDPTNPLREGPDAWLRVLLYREALRWSLLAADADLTAQPAEDVEAVRELFTADSTVEWATLPPPVEAESVAIARRVATRALDAAAAPELRVRTLSRQRWMRVGLVVAVLSVVGVVFYLASRPRDLAAGRPWRASSAYPGFVPEDKACDGNSTRIFFHTAEEASPWVEIDLGSPKTISSVEIANRADCCGDRAVPLVVEVGTTPDHWTEVTRRVEPFRTFSASFEPRQARYVRVRALRKTFLHLDRVSVR